MITLPRINPVTLKELRQLVRSRLILWGMALFPVVLLATTAIVLSSEMHDMSPVEATYGNGLGGKPLAAVAVLTTIVTCGLIPVFTSIKTAIETSRTSLGLEFTTTLTPAQIASGKITAAAILSAIAVALAMPFFVLSYLMRGVDLSFTVLLPVELLVGGVIMAAFGLLPACSRRSIAMKIILLFAVYALLLAFMSVVTAALTIESAMLGGGSSSWSFAGVFTLFYLPIAMIACCRAQAAAELAPPHTDFCRPLRITQAVLFAVGLPLVFVAEEAPCLMLSLAWTFAAGMIMLGAASRPLPITRGASLHAPRSLPLRLLAFPFATGSVPSMIFALLLALAAVAVIALKTHGTHEFDGTEKFMLMVFECGSLVMIAGSVARLVHASHRRLANALGKIAVAYIVMINVLNILAELDVLEKQSLRAWPCNIDGITRIPEAHIGLAVLFSLTAITLLVFAFANDFSRFRKP